MFIVGISGKKASGKNYFSDHVREELVSRGYTTQETSFGQHLKEETSKIIDTIRANKKKNRTIKEISWSVATRYLCDYQDAHTMTKLLYPVIDDPALNGWSRTNELMDSLQFWGTEVRRKQQDDYWVNKFREYVVQHNTTDFLFVSDARFRNEMDTIIDMNGLAVRLYVSPETLALRQQNRDGQSYNEKQMSHSSETSLDFYEKFSLIVPEHYSVYDVADYMERHFKAQLLKTTGGIQSLAK